MATGRSTAGAWTFPATRFATATSSPSRPRPAPWSSSAMRRSSRPRCPRGSRPTTTRSQPRCCASPSVARSRRPCRSSSSSSCTPSNQDTPEHAAHRPTPARGVRDTTVRTLMLDFQIPRITSEQVEDNRGSFAIEPLDRGFGYTFGNSLRRVLLSSLAGAAVTSVRIEGVAHEFSTIKGVTEDVTDIVLNLKGIVCRMHSEAAEIEAPLVVTGSGDVTAGDIDLPSGVEILNPETPIATLEKKTKLEMYLTIGHGRGYSPAEDNKTPDQPIGVIPIDSIFSPVKRVAYSVDAARVGQKTDYDKLMLDIETDGSIDPQAALREAAEILIKYLAIFTDVDRVEALRDQGAALVTGGDAGLGADGGGVPGAGGMDDILIEELELGVRSYNCLKRAGVQTVGDLVQKSESELNAIPNFGRKSIEEVKETLDARGLALRAG